MPFESPVKDILRSDIHFTGAPGATREIVLGAPASRPREPQSSLSSQTSARSSSVRQPRTKQQSSRRPQARRGNRATTASAQGRAGVPPALLLHPFGQAVNAAIWAGKKHHCAESGCGYVARVDWQQILSLMIVGIATTALLWGRFRPRKFRFGHDTHCGCASGPAGASQNSIIFHARKGHRPRVLVKMK